MDLSLTVNLYMKGSRELFLSVKEVAKQMDQHLKVKTEFWSLIIGSEKLLPNNYIMNNFY